MKMKRLLIGSVVLFLFGVSFFWKSTRPTESSSKLFTKIPVRFFPISNRPSVEIEIEGKAYSCLVDLGSPHAFDLHEKYLSQIKGKLDAGESKYYDAKGALFTTEKYLVPKIKLESLCFNDILVYQENAEFLNKDSGHWRSIWNRLLHQVELITLKGRIGRTLFQDKNCLFDFSRSAIFLLGDLPASFGAAGYFIDQFIALPFQMENCGIVLTMETEEGRKRFCLDTGTTHSVLRCASSDMQTRVETTLKSEDRDLGQWSFQAYPLSEKLPCDGILGVDFFKKHAIAFSFHNQTAYIRPEHFPSSAKN